VGKRAAVPAVEVGRAVVAEAVATAVPEVQDLRVKADFLENPVNRAARGGWAQLAAWVDQAGRVARRRAALSTILER
jgi:hypothetical protein